MIVPIIPVCIMDAVGDWRICGGHVNEIQNVGGDLEAD
jgi:hypothetical protein